MHLKAYYPMPKFPTLSLSGTQCQLHCKHCNATYLEGMLPVATPQALQKTCAKLARRGANGVLLSGGSDRQGGILNLKKMLPSIRQVKHDSGLILNLHPGLLDRATAQALEVDFVSLEIPSQHTITEVFRLDASIADYINTYDMLAEAGKAVVPHICVYNGNEHRLLRHIASAEHIQPQVIVVIVFSPTRETALAGAQAPTPQKIKTTIEHITGMFPAAEIALGCMRPRQKGLRQAIEAAALAAGVTRIALPSKATLRDVTAAGHSISTYESCCALPKTFEARVERKESYVQ